MVIRKRLRAVLIPLALYAVSGAVVGYFVYHANNGDRGLEAKKALKIDIARLNGDLAAAKAERADWERRIALLRADALDRDLLEERSRETLGRVHANDLIIMTDPQKAAGMR
ncbi:septum formation initiator family protein [Chelatococcus sp. SYSU_G07232]|uniref:Septum formation initiator family protein n=1 Tax=Chelatococcus albus TaxID=3047466 RepID=A0ABT7ABV0_9HYPH|nr:septum formation initiator family protein [Chelatococcus sp. SYSU_G07232]MDJ1156841.1 septum formation initiator family protein [Chelatococcus sp. SYSU_G07232]